ncbi:hypothetical protein HPB50_023441 [Hyalomma asiaticum]|uniref:Uncharacterized protein n=1 Tax=Hyalomma asiaticum TaxID=266040 RepID=A0ACB7TNF9_HYAAI|nr:hypothetical protein HPB50_023441 [Hyalomma asiaticum]
MRNDGSFLPVWSEFGRRLALMLVSSPKNAQLLERIGNARGLFGICASLAQYQPSVFRIAVALFAISGFLVPVGLGFLGLRFMGKCGGQRIQVITPLYNELYNGHCVALGALTITSVIVNVLLAFEQYLLQRLDVNPFQSKGPVCGKLLRAMLGENDEARNANCSALEQTQQQLVRNATKVFKKKTATERRRLARALRMRAFMVQNGSNANRKKLADIKVKFKNFDQRFQLRHLYGSLAPLLMMLLSMVVGVVAAFLVIGLAMGMLNHDRGKGPTLRNVFSHKAGLIMLYCPVVLFACSVLAVPLAGILLSGCVVGECYICEPYRGRERHILDEAATKLLSGATVTLLPSRILHSCTGRSKRAPSTHEQIADLSESGKLRRGSADHPADCTENCTHLTANATVDLNAEILQPALPGGAQPAECRIVYNVMSHGYNLFCGTLLGNYHGAWSSLLFLAALLMATAVVSVRLSKYHLVMDQYCYAGWDKRILRKAPKRRKALTKRFGRRLSIEDFSLPAASEGPEKDECDDTEADMASAEPQEHLSDSDEDPGSLGGWHSEAWLLGSLSKGGASSLTAEQADSNPLTASKSDSEEAESVQAAAVEEALTTNS